MATAATAAAIGIKINVDPKQAQKDLEAVERRIGKLGAGWTKRRSLDDVVGISGQGVAGLERTAAIFGRATFAAGKFALAVGGIGVTAAAAGIGGLVERFADAGAVAGRMSDRLGLPVQRLSEFQIAARLAGSSAEDMTQGLQGLQATVADAAYGRNNEAWSVFRSVGIDVGNAKTGVKDFSALLPQIANEVQLLAKASPNAAQRFLDLVGVGRALYPVFRNGAAGLNDYLDQAGKLGPLTAQQAADAREFEKVMTVLSLRLEDFARIGGSAIAPALTSSLKELGDYLAAHRDDVQQFFGSVEHGVEWLLQPKNISWLRTELGQTGDELKHFADLGDTLSHSWLVRRMLGLPQEGYGPDAGLLAPPGTAGQPTAPDTRSWLERFYKPGPGLLSGLSGFTPRPSSDKVKAASLDTIDYLTNRKGWELGAAEGVAGNLNQESGFDPGAVGDNGTAHGIEQWHPDRQAAIEAHFGKPLAMMSLHEQLDALDWETRNATPETFAKMQGMDARQAGATFSLEAERPGKTTSVQLDEARNRGNLAYQAAQDYKIAIEVSHINPPPGSQVNVVADQSKFDTSSPKVVGAMPTAGTQRNVGRDGY